MIVDSGSTKADWAVLDSSGEIRVFHGEGLNPMFLTGEEIVERTRATLRDLKDTVSAIHFYGASCSNRERISRVEWALSQVYPQAKIVVEHDLLGAGRGLLRGHKGVIGILGTGSNAGLYDGENITRKLGGLGYVLGDEGSGQDIGKRFIMKLMNRELPAELDKKFREHYGYSDDEISYRVYSKPLPNRFLAGFSRFVRDNIGYGECRDAAYESLELYVSRYIVRLTEGQQLPFAVIGSVGVAFHDILEEICTEKGVKLAIAAASPLEGLIEYHKSHV